jgi:hypothetical protein
VCFKNNNIYKLNSSNNYMRKPYFLQNPEQKEIEKTDLVSYIAQMQKQYPVIIFELASAVKSVKRGENPRGIKSKIERLVWGQIRRHVEYERFEKEMKLNHKYRIHYFFEDWEKLATPILADIIEKNGSKLKGFRFYNDIPASSISYSSSVGVNEVRVNRDGTYCLDIGDYDYSENLTPMERRYNPKELASEMLSGLESLYVPKKLHNKRRNKLVQEIEKRTGRNLKREVSNLKKN